MLRILLILLLASASGCEAWNDDGMEQNDNRMRAVDVKACVAEGGIVSPVCMSGVSACVVPYADAGSGCNDSSECIGRCLKRNSGSEAGGACEADNNPCGCETEVIGGEIQGTLCID